MKKIKFACNLSLLTLFALGQWACEWDRTNTTATRSGKLWS